MRQHRRLHELGARLRCLVEERAAGRQRRPRRRSSRAVLSLGQWYKVLCGHCGRSGSYYGSGASVRVQCACGQPLFYASWHSRRVSWALWCPVCLEPHRQTVARTEFPLTGKRDGHVISCDRTGAAVLIIGSREATEGVPLAVIASRFHDPVSASARRGNSLHPRF